MISLRTWRGRTGSSGFRFRQRKVGYSRLRMRGMGSVGDTEGRVVCFMAFLSSEIRASKHHRTKTAERLSLLVAAPARWFLGLESGLSGALRRPGFPGICRACPAASDSIGTYEDVGTVLITLSTSSVPSFRFSISVARGPAITAIRTSPGCFPFERKIFPPALLPYRGTP
jgi:hypothetical protein